ncbi:protein SABRE isoform X2 [Phalaenopsis equestris]|nr:protein SABRE isoform X2 [Phalaenopsis equestris]
MRCGDTTIKLCESLFVKTKLRSDAFAETGSSRSSGNDLESAKLSQNNNLSSMLKKQIILFPDKVNFRLPKLNLRFVHLSQGLLSESNVMGIHLRSNKSQVLEDSGDMTSHLDIQTDMTEIHVLKEVDSSILEILKVVLTASVDVPMQLPQPIRSEIDLKLGGTQCNLVVNRLKPWLSVDLSKKKERVVHADQEEFQKNKNAAIMWTFTVSAPEMTVVLYSLNDVPLYYGCSQSSHLYANNIATKGVQVHAELGEVHFYMADEYQKCVKLDLFDAEANFGSLLHMARAGLDWGLREMETHEEQDSNRLKLVFAIDITGMGLYFNFSHIESILLTFFSFQPFFKSLTFSRKRDLRDKVGHSRKTNAKGTRIVKVNLEKCHIKYCGEVSKEDMVIADPKRVNFGSQGGVVMISVSADGTTRRARIFSNTTSGCKKLKFYTSLSISQVNVCLNKEKRSLQIDLERARSIYQESSHDQTNGSKITLFDVQHAKFVRRSGGLSEVAVCSLLNVTDISIRWEPDVHLAIFEFVTALKCFLHKIKNHGSHDGIIEELHSLKDRETEKEIVTAQAKSYKKPGKREAVFAIDVEKLKLTAAVADGVEASIHVQSIFSENARIGVLLEELILCLNNANVFKSSRMQISRIPVSATGNSVDAKGLLTPSWDNSTWDWVIQGPDLHICMPYRLQLRAIEDAVEDMLRGLKLITDAKASLMLNVKKDNSRKPKSKPANFGTIRFIIRKLTADIEEEPIQGWLDEHYQLMKTEICEAAIRAKFLDDFLDMGSNSRVSEPKELSSERKLFHNGVEIDTSNDVAIKDLHEDIQKQAFRSYYRACKKLVPSEGSGACTNGFQSGFKTSKNRASLLSICATELDVTLTKVVGGDAAMVEFIKKMDPVSLENDVPFSRTYGRDVDITSGSLVVQLRNYTFPLFSATAGKCKGRIVLAQQATSFQPQVEQDVYIGKWWKVRMLRSASGTTPPMKIYSDLPIYFNKAEISFGVGYEPGFADISYAFTVALRRANLGTKSWTSTTDDQNISVSNPPKRERSLPWWDDVRYYIHGKNCLFFMETRWNLLATTNPYEKLDELKIVSAYMEIQQTDGRLFILAKDFKIYLSSLESLVKNCSLKLPSISVPFLHSPAFSLEVTMDWDCESGFSLNHYLHAFPKEGEPRKKVFDPFRSTSLSLRWNFSLRPSLQCYNEHSPFSSVTNGLSLDESSHDSSQTIKSIAANSPTMNLGAHDLAWLFKWWSLNYSPPHKLRSFSRWPRFGVIRAPRSGNLSLDKVMTEFFLRLDATPSCIRYTPLSEDDPASGLTFEMTRLKYELCYSRGKQSYTFDCKRELLDLVYQGLDLHLLKAFICNNNKQDVQSTKGASLALSTDNFANESFTHPTGSGGKNGDDGFLLYSDYFTIRRQAPKADSARLLAWQEAGRRNLEMTYVRSEFENGSESDHTRSDPSDDDGFNVVIADNCRRVFVYGLKLLWTIENRDAVWSWVGGISKAFEPQKPSPSRQYAQRKLLEQQKRNEGLEIPNDDNLRPLAIHGSNSPSSHHVEAFGSLPSVSVSAKMDCTTSNTAVNHGRIGDSEEDGARHFMVNVIQPQFNLHSEEANGRFLLAAASGRVLARSFHSIFHVGYEMIEQALGTSSASFPDMKPEMTWKRAELSVMLEHVQAHVAPTDVDPGAGLQWLPKILRSSPKVKRTGALLERVFMPCQMYFRYTRHKGGTSELKVKPLKELIFNSPNITATMTSRQFQVMLDVLSSLLFARLPKPRKSSLSYPTDDDDDVEEEADEVVPDGVEEVELARIQLEQKERERKLFLDDIRTLTVSNDIGGDLSLFTDRDNDLWMLSCGKLRLIRGLRKELGNAQKSRKEASSALRLSLQKAAQLRLMEKEKNKSPSCAMRISMRINKVVWSMLADGKSFAEAEINDMIYDFDRDYKDIGVAQFTTKSFVVRNCLPNAKSDMLLSAWNAPPEWGKNVMLRVNAKQGAPKDGSSPLELFQVEIYPLKIHLTETMYRMMWGYFFPEEDQDSQRRQEVWKVSTTAGSRRVRKSASAHETIPSSSYSAREIETTGRPVMAGAQVNPSASVHGDSSQVSKLQSLKANIVCGANPEFRRTPSCDRIEDTLFEVVANEPLFPLHSSCISSKSGPLNPALESQQAVTDDTFKSKSKDPKPIKSGRLSNEEKKVGKAHDEKRARSRRMMEFHNIKISQVELLVAYEGSRFAVNDLRLLMDTFHRDEFIGTWRRLFSRVKKHIIWGVLKSVTGMQGKKFKDKAQTQREGHVGVVPESDLNFSDSDGGQPGKLDQFPVSWLKRPSDGAGDRFVTSIRGLFNSQRRKAKAFVLRTMRGEADNEFNGEWSESDTEYPFARQLTITKAKKLIRRHTRKFRSRAQKNSGAALQIRESHPSTPRETSPFQSDSSGASSYEDFND